MSRHFSGHIQASTFERLNMSLATYTLIHVVISLIGIAAGFAVMVGMMKGRRLDRWTALFLDDDGADEPDRVWISGVRLAAGWIQSRHCDRHYFDGGVGGGDLCAVRASRWSARGGGFMW